LKKGFENFTLSNSTNKSISNFRAAIPLKRYGYAYFFEINIQLRRKIKMLPGKNMDLAQIIAEILRHFKKSSSSSDQHTKVKYTVFLMYYRNIAIRVNPFF
jgi:galactose-1-phosphate uridylyltransferase